MKIISLLAYLTTTFQNGLLVPLEAEGAVQRVVGGNSATNGKFPYQALLTDGGTICGGCIIDNHWIVTAASCTSAWIQPKVKIYVGSVRLYQGFNYTVARFEQHPAYNRKTKHNDIALVKTTDPIIFGPFVKSINLATKRYPINTQLTLTGWGSTSTSTIPRPSSTLQYVVLQISSMSDCLNTWDTLNVSTNLCTYSGIGIGPCVGDNGSPLVSKTQELVALVSYGYACAVGVPDVHTDVFAFAEWINERCRRKCDRKSEL